MIIKVLIIIFFWSNLTGFYPQESHERNGKSDQVKPHIVFLISKDVNNYEADRTIPGYAEMLESRFSYETTVIQGEGERTSFHFPCLKVLQEADLLVIFTRRVALKTAQMNRIKQYLKEGKSLLGIRTANHAFSLRGEPEEGYTDWWDFVSDILGCKNRGYGSVELGTDVSIPPEVKNHSILKDIAATEWHSTGNVYHVEPLLDGQAEVLLEGAAGDQTEPVAWSRTTDAGSPVFYTSLGHPSDFENDNFIQLLTNAVHFLTEKRSL